MQFKVISPLNHDGIKYEVGEVLNLSDSDGEALLSCEAVELVDQPFSLKLKPLAEGEA
ncbi:MAG: hypothetical protein HY777_04040 [Betaproteobacteria bacterium]|nr:hypothetical protein [Betaproteobacteria bacterium]